MFWKRKKRNHTEQDKSILKTNNKISQLINKEAKERILLKKNKISQLNKEAREIILTAQCNLINSAQSLDSAFLFLELICICRASPVVSKANIYLIYLKKATPLLERIINLTISVQKAYVRDLKQQVENYYKKLNDNFEYDDEINRLSKFVQTQNNKLNPLLGNFEEFVNNKWDEIEKLCLQLVSDKFIREDPTQRSAIMPKNIKDLKEEIPLMNKKIQEFYKKFRKENAWVLRKLKSKKKRRKKKKKKKKKRQTQDQFKFVYKKPDTPINFQAFKFNLGIYGSQKHKQDSNNNSNKECDNNFNQSIKNDSKRARGNRPQ